jgi:uncharacterized protein (TIGR03435 family)
MVVALVLLLAGSGSAAAQAVFDVASVRAAQDGRESIEVVPGSLTMRNVRMSGCLGWAYSVQDFQISGPGWLTEARFDIVAKAGTAAPEAELRLMLRSLLADRFKLAVRRESRELQALVLVVGKNGHKLKPNDVEGSPSFKTGKLNLTGDGATLSQLTGFLSKELRQPVVDQTGLTGRFNYFLDINAYITEEIRKSGGPNGGPPLEAPSIIAQALQQQLGLKVEPRKAPVEMLLVEHIEKTPTEN